MSDSDDYFRKAEFLRIGVLGERGSCIYRIFNLITGLCLIVCAGEDIRRYRIPNRWIAAAVLFGLLGQGAEALAGGAVPPGALGGADKGIEALTVVLSAAGRMLLAGALVLPMHRLGMIGGGDIKVMALAVGWLGFWPGMQAVGIGLVLGAALALSRMLRYKSAAERFLYLSAYVRRAIREKEIDVYYDAQRDGRDCVIPLGACICAGILIRGVGM